MTGRAYFREVLNYVWLKSVSELLDKQVNAQKESKYFWGSRKLPQAHEKVCDENEKTRKNDTHVKMLIMEGSPL